MTCYVLFTTSNTRIFPGTPFLILLVLVCVLFGFATATPDVIGSLSFLPPLSTYQERSIALELNNYFEGPITTISVQCTLASCILEDLERPTASKVLGWSVYSIGISGNRAYIGGQNYLSLWDLTDPINITLIEEIFRNAVFDMAFDDQFSYLATSDGLEIVQLPDFGLLSNVSTPNIRSVVQQGNFAYLSSQNEGVIIVDVQDPSSPLLVSSFPLPSSNGMAIKGNLLFVPNPTERINIYDIGDPFNVSQVSFVDTGTPYRVAVRGDWLYVADFGNGFKVVDISVPSHPSIFSPEPNFVSALANDVVLSGDLAYVAMRDLGVTAYNISNLPNVTVAFNVTNQATVRMALMDSYVYCLEDDVLNIFGPYTGTTLRLSVGAEDRFNESISITACDSTGCATLHTEIFIPNYVPEIYSQDINRIYAVGDNFQIWVSVQDSDPDYLQANISNLPNGLSYSIEGSEGELNINISGRFLSGAQGNRTTIITATDGFSETSYSLLIPVSNRTPLVNRLSGTVGIVSELRFEYTFASDVFRDEDNDTLTFSALLSDGSPLPSVLQFFPERRTLEGILSSTQTVEFIASDGYGGNASFSIEFQVSGGGFPLWGIILIVALSIVTVIALLAAIGGWIRSSRKSSVEEGSEMKLVKENKQDDLVLPKVVLTKWMHNRTKIGNRYYIMTHVRQEEAIEIFNQSGLKVIIPNGEQSTKLKIGKGNFGCIKVAFDDQNGQFVACKVVKGEGAVAQSLEEAQLQRDASQPSHLNTFKDNILPIYNTCQIVKGSTPIIYHFMPLCGLGNGSQMIKMMRILNKEDLAYWIFHVANSLLTGVANIHSGGIFHCDLKCENLVFQRDGTVFITDFGCAERSSNGEISKGNGDGRYFSPERVDFFRSKDNREKLDGVMEDSWAVGLILLDFSGLSNPFTESLPSRKRVQQWTFEKYASAFESIEELRCPPAGSLYEVISALLRVRRSERATLAEARALKYFQKVSSKERVKNIVEQFTHFLAQPPPSVSSEEEEETHNLYANFPEEKEFYF